MAAGWVAVLIAAFMALSGVRAIDRGRIVVHRRRAERQEQPGGFWVTVILLRFGVAAVLLVAGIAMLL